MPDARQTFMRLTPFAACVALVATSEAANLEGQLLDGSSAGGTVAGHPVRLTAQLADQTRIDQTIETDATGVFAFVDVPGDTADVYVVSTSYDGVDYVSNFVRFPYGADLVETDLVVYASTTDASHLRLNARHLIVEIAPAVDHAMVTEVLAFGNPGTHTIIPDAPLTLRAPSGAFGVESVEGFDDARVLGDELALSLGGSVRPGTFRYEGAVRYRLPAMFPMEISSASTLPVDEVTVLVSPPGTRVEGQDLEALGTIDLGEGVLCDRFRVPVDPETGHFAVSIVPALDLVTRGPRVFVISLSLLATFAGLALLRSRPAGDSAPGPEVARLRADLDRYLGEIAALDARGDETGGERQKLFVKATAIQELIDELAERGA